MNEDTRNADNILVGNLKDILDSNSNKKPEPREIISENGKYYEKILSSGSKNKLGKYTERKSGKHSLASL